MRDGKGANVLRYNIVEGCLTAVVALASFFIIPDFPEEAGFLTGDERAFVKARLQADVGNSGRHTPLTIRSVLAVFKDCQFKLLAPTILTSSRAYPCHPQP